MDLAAFDFHLPEERIAQEPLADRAASRMLVVHRAEGQWEDRTFRDFPAYLSAGDCLILNDSRVFPARLFGTRTGRTGAVEVLLLRACGAEGREWTALVRPGRKLGLGERIRFANGLEAEIAGRGEFGERTLRFDGPFHTESDLLAEFEKIGHVPLPPYIKRGDHAADRERYQTVFAREPGSVAAPTAGLHFTPEILEACRARGADVAYVTLHVGLGTFQPLHEDQVERAALHAESYRITEQNAARMRAAARLVCAGTTSVRTVESALRGGILREGLRAQSGDTDIFIYPGFEFRGAGAILTNFHLPKTSLLLLVCAFAGTELALAAYRHAVEEHYRFYSYGDCMLIV